MPFALTRILSYFYEHGGPVLAVVDPESVFQGFVLRQKLDAILADLGRARQSHERIPPELLSRPPYSTAFLASVSALPGVPVIGEAGDFQGFWDQGETLQRLSDGQKRSQNSIPEGEPVRMVEKEGHDQFLTRMILSAYPEPLYAARLDGSTLFFNQDFDERIIGHRLFKHSIRLLEEYFRELTREELARAYTRSTGVERLRVNVPELGYQVQISNLEEKHQVVGYLYLLRPVGPANLMEEVELLYHEADLDTIIDDIESALILKALKESDQNISHAAAALKVKRSTLQNKMKRLQLAEKYGYRTQGPVPRKRKIESSAQEAPVFEKGPKLVEKKGAPAATRPKPGGQKPAKARKEIPLAKKKKALKPARKNKA